MGLGKTLSLLALICWSLDSQANSVVASKGKESRTTLIVAPKSSRFAPAENDDERELRKLSNIWMARAD